VGRSQPKTDDRAREFGVSGYTDVGEMLQTEQPDLVSLCLPNEGHYETTLAVIEAGFPLLVEKPLVFDLDEADRLLAAAAAQDLFFALNFNHRYAVPVQMAHRAIHAGELGQLVFATWRFGGEVGTSAHPHANLIETQCHGFDMLEHLCGPIASISAHMNDLAGHGYTTMALSLTFESGAVGSLVGSYDTSYAYPDTHYVEVNGTEGRVQVFDTVKRFTQSRVGEEVRRVWEAGYFNDAQRDFYHLFERHLDDLIPAFRESREPPVHARAGRRALQLAMATIESFEQGRRVSVA
jgi:predicted dehydrogenase